MYIEDSEPSYEDLSTSSPSPRRPTARSSPGPSQESRPKHSRMVTTDTPLHFIQYGQQLSTASPSPICLTARSSPGPGQEISKLAW